MKTIIHKRKALTERWIARIISTFFGLVFALFVIGSYVTYVADEGGSLVPEGEGIPMSINTILLLVSVVIAWFKEKAGGALLILSFLALSISGLFIAGSDHYLPVLLSFPYLISGILYLLYYKANKRII